VAAEEIGEGLLGFLQVANPTVTVEFVGGTQQGAQVTVRQRVLQASFACQSRF
jgi:hypothetical protein